MYIGGIDEVRKGALVGNAFLCLAYGTPEQISILETDSLIKDSKLLSKPLLTKLAKKLIDFYKINYQIIQLTPLEIDNTNLNNLLFSGFCKFNFKNIFKIYCDCPWPNITKFKIEFTNVVKGIEVIVEHKADQKYKITSAASIIAKYFAQQHVFQLNQKFNNQIGSGYPSDPKTRIFYFKNKDNLHAKDLIRFKWNISDKI